MFDLTDENKEILKKYNQLWEGNKNNVEVINDDQCKCGKDFTKVKFDTDDNLPLNRSLSLRKLTIAFRAVFEDEGKFYMQVNLDECLCELQV